MRREAPRAFLRREPLGAVGLAGAWLKLVVASYANYRLRPQEMPMTITLETLQACAYRYR
jgi:hypothetical protein